MKQSLTITLDVPADCTLKFDEGSMKVYFEKDDKNFKKLLEWAFSKLPKIVNSIPIWYGHHTHDGDADSCFALTEAPNDDCEVVLDMLIKATDKKQVKQWLKELEESVPTWAQYDEDDIYKYWDPSCDGTYLYVNRDMDTEEFYH